MISFVQLPYRKREALHKAAGLGPAAVGISLTLVLLLQVAVIVWLYFHQGRL